jgi:hypothetical protein
MEVESVRVGGVELDNGQLVSAQLFTDELASGLVSEGIVQPPEKSRVEVARGWLPSSS